ncbi:MAG: glycosyltransferase family 2 protein [Planctomycetaceae bacterium]
MNHRSPSARTGGTLSASPSEPVADSHAAMEKSGAPDAEASSHAVGTHRRFDPPPFITVVVPVRNEERFIEATLVQLLTQDYNPDRFEVIVADGESTDRTRDVVRRLQETFHQLKLVSNPKRWSSAGRNAAISAGQGDVFVVVDGHCQLHDQQYLQCLARAFADPNVDCVGRPQPLDVSGANAVQQAIAAARSSRLGHHPASFIYSDEERFVPPQSVAVAYRRDVFERIGRFDESFDACEDVEFNVRVSEAGFRCWLTPQASVRYVPRGTLRGLFRQLVRYGRGRMRLVRKNRSTFSWGSSLPALFVLGIIVGALAASFHGMLAAAYFSVLGIYAAIVLLTSIGAAIEKRKPSFLILLPAVFATIHFASGWGYLWEFVRAGKR